MNKSFLFFILPERECDSERFEGELVLNIFKVQLRRERERERANVSAKKE